MLYTVTIQVHVTAETPMAAEKMVMEILKVPGVIAVTPKSTEEVH